jgi:NitT/TauT family transport system substrate-binding protein
MQNKLVVSIFIAILIILGVFATFNSLSSSKDVVNIGYLPSDHESALLVAEAKNWYKDNNITVNLVEFSSGGNLMVAIASGHIDVGYVGIPPVLGSISKGIPVKVVSSVQNEGSGIVVANDSCIHSIEDLNHKRIATPGTASIQNVLLTYALKQHGISKNNVSVSDSNVASMINALRTNKIDAIVAYQPYVTIPVDDGSCIEIASSHDILPNHPCCVMVAREDFIKNKKSTLKTILDIHENATKFINNHSDEAASLLPDTLVKDVSVEEKSLKNIEFTHGLDDAYVNRVMDFIKLEMDLGFVKKPIPKEKIFEYVN